MGAGIIILHEMGKTTNDQPLQCFLFLYSLVTRIPLGRLSCLFLPPIYRQQHHRQRMSHQWALDTAAISLHSEQWIAGGLRNDYRKSDHDLPEKLSGGKSGLTSEGREMAGRNTTTESRFLEKHLKLVDLTFGAWSSVMFFFFDGSILRQPWELIWL